MSRKKIGTHSVTVRLYVSDEKYIKNKVTTEGQADTRFSSRTNAVRHYVQFGIAAERQVESANTLGQRIIKESQKEVVIDSLRPLKEALDKLTLTIGSLGASQQTALAETTRATTNLSDEVRNLAETGQRELANIFIIRSVLFVFLLGIKTNRIQPDERTPWDKLITFAHERAQQLAAQEVVAGHNADSELVRKLANELFAAVKNFQPKS